MMTVEVLHSRHASKHLTSSAVDLITVVNVDGPDNAPTDAAPAYRLESHVRHIVRLVPVDKPTAKMVGPMFGGNYAACSDSRFTRAVQQLTGMSFYGAVAIHDRFETAEEYASNSY